MPTKTGKHTDETVDCDLHLASETLAVAFSECRRRKSFENERRGSLASNHRGGKSLFRKFVKENSTTVWKPDLVKSISSVRFGGYLHDPPTLLLQGDSDYLQHIRDGWSNRLLRSPTGFHIDFVGDVTRIGARPLSRERFIPLCDATCVAIGNVTSRDDIATQEAILIELERAFAGIHSPSRELLHETLGKLIRNRKVFCTGPGYHLVTTKTYSGKSSSELESTEEESTISKHCETCDRNRKIFETNVKERRSYRVKRNINHQDNCNKENQEMPHGGTDSENSRKVVFDTEPLHGSVVRHPEAADQAKRDTSERLSPQKVEREETSRKSGNGIVEKMAEKLFRRRRKLSSSDRKKHSNTKTAQEDLSSKVRELTETDAIQLGYEANTKQHVTQTKSRNDSRSSSESPVKRTNSTSRKSSSSRRSSAKDSNRAELSRSFRYESKTHTSPIIQQPDVIPESQRKKHSTRITSHTNNSIKKDHLTKSLDISKSLDNSHSRHQLTSSNNQFPAVRDAAVSCNLDDEVPVEKYDTFHVDMRNFENDKHDSYTTINRRDFSPTKKVDRTTLRRSKSLRLPRDHRRQGCEDYHNRHQLSSFVSPQRHLSQEHHGVHKSEGATGMSYDTLKKSLTTDKMRRSVSSSSTGREYSYLHACHFAPSVRVGSVIADHLEELDRRRHYINQPFVREMSPTSSLSSSLASNRSSEAFSSANAVQRIDVASVSLQTDMMSPPRQQNIGLANETEERIPEKPSSPSNEVPNDLDPETKAALKVAKRLAKLDIKMTREEWKEYFSSKLLPDHVEEALSKSRNQEEQQNREPYSQTCFENTSGSVETVIDVKQRNKPRKTNSSNSSNKSSPSFENDKFKTLPKTVRRDGYYSLRGTNEEENTYYEEDIHRDVFLESETKFYKCPDINYEENHQRNKLYYTCDHGHQHLPYCDNHKQLSAMDSASLTEDSGFHSARERSSLSSWDNRKHQRGTFV